MSDGTETVMNAIQKSINLFLSMSRPNEDNEIKEQSISAMATVLLFDQKANLLYDVEMSYRDIFRKNDAGAYKREENAAQAAFQNQKVSIVASDQGENASRRLRYAVKFRVLDEIRPLPDFRDDFARLDHLSRFLPDRSWSAILCAMICESANREIGERIGDFKEQTHHYAQINAPNATGVSHFHLAPVLSRSRDWKWAIGACVVDFRGAER